LEYVYCEELIISKEIMITLRFLVSQITCKIRTVVTIGLFFGFLSKLRRLNKDIPRMKSVTMK